MNETVRSLLDREPWDERLERLTAYAHKEILHLYWRGERSALIPGGQEAVDIALAAIGDVYSGVRSWIPEEQPDLMRFLLGVVKSKISNAVRSRENQDRRPTDDMPEPARSDPDDTFFWGLYEDLASEPELQRALDAVFDGHVKNEDIAAAMGVPAAHMVNIRKRLKRRITAYRARLETI